MWIHNRSLCCGCNAGRTAGFDWESSQDSDTDWKDAWCRQTHTQKQASKHAVFTHEYWYIRCVYRRDTQPLQSNSGTWPRINPQHPAWFALLQTSSNNRALPWPHSICSWTAGLANKLPRRVEAGGRLSCWLICRVIGWERLKQPKDINISHPVGRWVKFHGVINSDWLSPEWRLVVW